MAVGLWVLVAVGAGLACGAESDEEAGADAAIDDRVGPLEPVDSMEVGGQQARELFSSPRKRFETDEPFAQVYWMVEAGGIDGLQYRVPDADGWSTWRDVEVRFSEGDLFNVVARLDEPVRAIEFRGVDEIRSAKIWFHPEVLVSTGGADRPTHDIDPAGRPAAGEPGIVRQAIAPDDMVVLQAQWGSDEPGKVCGWAHDPDKMTIHHTAIPSSDGGDPAARMRGMQSAHKDLGWCDIGYHFVVSQSGKIFQGRSQSGRTGAHTSDYNTDNVGIALIGNYDVDFPPQAQLDAAAQIVEWVHTEHGIALDRSVVKGHREWPYQSTTCPGDNLLNQLEDLLDAAGSDPTGPGDVDDPEPGGCTPTVDDEVDDSMFADFQTSATGYDEAVRLYDHGITTGCDQSPLKFCPDCPLTRSQMAVFLVRAADLDMSDPPADPSFDDVSPDSYAYPYIEAAYDAEITTGCGDDSFCPNEDVTRAQAAVMIQRALDWPDEVPDGAPTFDDVDDGAYFYEAVETLNQRCVTDGCGDGEFCPGDQVTRAHAAAFVSRAFNLDDSNPCAQPGGCSPHPAFGTEDSLFADFPTDQFGYEEAALVYDEEIAQGCTDEEFCPDCPTDRRQMVIFAARAADLDVSNPPAEPTFDDVDDSATGYEYIEAAWDAGWIDGCDDDNFCPNDEVSRAQTATVLKRAMDWTAAEPDEPTFDDVSQSSVHYDGVETVRDRCVTDGCDDGEFCPDGNVPRSHMAIFVARALNLDDINSCAESGGGGDAPETSPDEPESEEGGQEPEQCEDVDPDFIPQACEEEIEDWDSDESYPDPDGDHDPADEGDDEADDSGEEDDSGDGETRQDRDESEEGGCSVTGDFRAVHGCR